MLDEYKSLPFIAGVSILLLVPFATGALVYSSLRDDLTGNQTGTADSQAKSNTFNGLDKKQNIQLAPDPSGSSRGAGIESNPEGGIPIGKYSNPPTSVKSFGTDRPDTSRPLEDFGSSVESNRLSQQNTNRLTPDYSNPSSSNNFNRTEDNSLIDSLEEDPLLGIPENNDEESVPLSPIEEPLFQR